MTYYNYCSIIAVKGGSMNDKALNIKIPTELYQRLQEEAKKKGLSMASLVRMICNEYLDKK